MIKQLAICSTSDGVIGYQGELAFQSKLDMTNFVKFTKRTVLIGGRTTAQEMIQKGFKPDANRPIVVISENKLVDCDKALIPHIFYAVSLDLAIETATLLAQESGLLGYTVIGGKTVYDEFLASKEELDAVYLALIDADQSDLQDAFKVRLQLPAGKGIVQVLNQHLGGGARIVTRNSFEVSMELNEPKETRASAVFTYLYNGDVLDPSRARLTPGGYIKVTTGAGEHNFHASAVTSYVRERERNLIRVFANGIEFSIRMDSPAQINYLQHIIDQNLA